MIYQTGTDAKSHIEAFNTYVDELHRTLIDKNIMDAIRGNDYNLQHLLDGRASAVLHQTVPLTKRKEKGIFFTNRVLAEKISSYLSDLLSTGIKVADPACGAGNLLISCARYLPIGNDLAKTVDIWSNLISGYDLFEEFILSTKLRLVLLAAIRSMDVGSIQSIVTKMEAFPGVRVKDVFSNDDTPERVDCVVVNPPFGYMEAPDDCEWATGLVQEAGLFSERIIRSAPEGQQIMVILPDVLRSGTRYKKWRHMVASLTSSLKIELTGRFDEEADVDVFILQAVAGSDCKPTDWSGLDKSVKKPTKLVSDFFDVHVGPVVPHRDKKEGPSCPYIHARTTPAWETIAHIGEKRKYSGKVFKSPFVVVHRTSSPRDKYRCVGTIVNANTEVAVENHLIILLPRDGSLGKCEELLRILKDENTNKWMNNRICCRHLTVPAIKELPWWS